MTSESTIKNEAARLVLLLDVGVVTDAEVIAWADSLIVQIDKPSGMLIDLSLAKGGGIRDALSSLAEGVDVWPTVGWAMPALIDYVTKHREKAVTVASAFYHIAVEQRYEVPAKYGFFNSAEDDFALAEEGVFVFEEVYARFLEDMRRSISI